MVRHGEKEGAPQIFMVTPLDSLKSVNAFYAFLGVRIGERRFLEKHAAYSKHITRIALEPQLGPAWSQTLKSL